MAFAIMPVRGHAEGIKEDGAQVPYVQQLTIDANKRFQTIRGFGASDCWMADYVGKYWAEPEKEKIAAWLFSRNLKSDGSPAGIGLSMWRFNLGAGTAEQGDDSGIQNLPRRAECFFSDIYRGAGYDWSKQQGQQYFLYKAHAYGVESVVLFSNSPPVAFTRNGKGYADPGGVCNLRDDAYGKFAVYLADVAAHFRQQGIPVDYISPVNEPQYNWDGSGQEGSPWSNENIARLAKELDREIQARCPDTKILITEAGAWNALFENNGRASDQIRAFFDPSSDTYTGDLPSMPQLMGAHSYWSHGTDRVLRSTRVTARRAADTRNLELFQTEWSMLQGGDGLPADINSASYFDMALFMAKIIHSDLVYAGASSWSFWTAMDMDRDGLKNRYLLIALDPAQGGDHHPMLNSGTAEARDTLWVLGNYSFFIRPGYTRIALNGADDLKTLMGSAYIAPDKSRIVAVYVNMDTAAHRITSDFSGAGGLPHSYSAYISSEQNNLKMACADKPFSTSEKLEIPARSVYTVVYDFPPTRTIDEVFPGDPESEYDHQFEGNNARSGFNNNGYWRDATGNDGGFYQYTFTTNGLDKLSLEARYWGNDTGDRTFDIYINGNYLTTENISGKWSQDNFVSVDYPLPPEMVQGRNSISVRFQSDGAN
ncbi:MAG: hypothetical protein FWF29_04290, partial [Treponema sp.]|nr:hypothetical protein [Treponema sp.]